ncbi:MAG: hypothetical protein OD817_04235 [Gammaproteobacteria bacterium]
MALKRERRAGDIFSMSFLDIICCGFGAMVLLVLLSNTDVLSGVLGVERARGMLGDIAAARAGRAAAFDERARLAAERARLEAQLRELANAPAPTLPELQQQLDARREKVETLRREVEALTQGKSGADEVEVVNVGGIAVDSEHIIFIVDTSGSMGKIWPRVMRKLENVLDIHPQVKGFQIMNDNGRYLWSAYARKWISDTPARRKSALRLMQNWSSVSSSSPIEGLRAALRAYAKTTDSLAIYVFGDDYSGSSYDAAVDEISDLNRDRKTGRPRARIHGIGFLPTDGSVNAARFAALMRELARRNGGAFVGIEFERRVGIGESGSRSGG